MAHPSVVRHCYGCTYGAPLGGAPLLFFLLYPFSPRQIDPPPPPRPLSLSTAAEQTPRARSPPPPPTPCTR